MYIIKLLGNLLITIGEDKMMYIWDVKRLLNRKFDISKLLNKANNVMLKEPIKCINFNHDENNFINSNDIILCIAHPATYLNKILIGYSSGKMQLWNINSCQCIYTFKNHQHHQDYSIFDTSSNINGINNDIISSITCIEPSPILDVVGIGYSTGVIVIHNVKTDETVMKFEHYNHKSLSNQRKQNGGSSNFSVDAVHGRINGLTFRKDGVPYLVSVGSDSNIVIWNLKKRKLENVYYNAHNDRIIGAKFIENENILLTSSVDNSLKMWIFDDDDNYGYTTGQLRLLKQRSGHSSQPYLCKFHGRKSLLSTSNDNTLRVSWIQRDIQCLSMGQRSVRKQSNKYKYSVPRIKYIDSSMNKSRYWSNVVTVHNHDNKVRLWSTQKFKLNEKMLEPAYNNKASTANVSCAIISHCGNFVYVGRISGVIDKYNIESGIHRLQISNAHTKIIRSLHLSLFNNVLISCSADGLIKFWNVGSKNNNIKCQYIVEDIRNNNEVISRSCYDKRSNLLAIATDNLFIYLFDGANGKLIRKFNLNSTKNAKYYSHITEMIFSPRCKWLLVSTMDGCCRVYDLMSGLIIDWFKFDNAVTSMSFAVNNTFLATTHINTMGIHIWANKHHFTQTFLKNVGNKPILMDKIFDNEATKLEQIKNGKNENEEGEKRKVDEAMKIAKNIGVNDESEDEESDESSDFDLDDVLDTNYNEESQDDDDEEEYEDDIKLADIASLHLNDDNDLITMSSNPRSVWKNLANWDLILQRNRPSMKVKKNVSNIPFFIPTKLHHQWIEMDTTEFSKELEEKKQEIENKMKLNEFEKRKKILKHVENKFKIDHKLFNKYNTTSRMIYFIKKEFDEKNNNKKEINYKLARDYLLSLIPSAADAELHSIGITIGSSKNELGLMFKFFIYQLKTNRNFEHIMSYISLFLKIHSDLIIKYSQSLYPLINKLKELTQDKWLKINDLFQSNLCLIQFYSRLQQ